MKPTISSHKSRNASHSEPQPDTLSMNGFSPSDASKEYFKTKAKLDQDYGINVDGIVGPAQKAANPKKAEAQDLHEILMELINAIGRFIMNSFGFKTPSQISEAEMQQSIDFFKEKVGNFFNPDHKDHLKADFTNKELTEDFNKHAPKNASQELTEDLSKHAPKDASEELDLPDELSNIRPKSHMDRLREMGEINPSMLTQSPGKTIKKLATKALVSGLSGGPSL